MAPKPKARKRLVLTTVDESMLRMLGNGFTYADIARIRGCHYTTVQKGFYGMRQENEEMSTREMIYQLGRFDENAWAMDVAHDYG